VRESTDLRTTELRSSEVRDSVMVAVHDTIMETTTIVIDRNEAGDTVFTSVVTERDRIRNRDRVRDNHEKTVIRTDTVFVERRDSVKTTESHGSSARASPVVRSLRWVCFVIVALIVLRGCPFLWRREKN
jgi:hypothetical protein